MNGEKMQEILLLEDDKALNRGITLTLQKAGYQVTSAFTLSEAEAYFGQRLFALVISDITLPDGTGLDFGRKVREAGNAYLIYLTALDTEEDIVNGYDAGADDYIAKPFSLMVLVSKVNGKSVPSGKKDDSDQADACKSQKYFYGSG